MAFLAPLAGVFGGGAAAGGGLGLGSILSAGSSILGTIGAIGSANYQAQVAKNNAKIAEENARNASQASQTEQQQNDQQTLALVGEQEAIQGASGLSVSGGSQLRTRRSAQRLGRQDSINIRTQGQSEVRNLLQQAENFRGEARAQKSAAFGSAIGGIFDVGASLVGGARSVRSANRITASSSTASRPQVRIRTDLRRARV